MNTNIYAEVEVTGRPKWYGIEGTQTRDAVVELKMHSPETKDGYSTIVWGDGPIEHARTYARELATRLGLSLVDMN
jgi:diphthamide synthase (EF-2-diphthine--ammonia ligase)